MAKKPAKKAAKPAKKAAPKKTATKKPTKSSKGTTGKDSNRGRTTTSAKASAAADRGSKTRSASKPRNPSGTYTQSEFIENLRAFCGLTKRSEAKEIAEDIATLIKDTLRRGFKIPMFGLGKMYVRQTKARTGRNPATGEEMHIPAKKRVRFAPAKALKEAVL